LKRQEIRFIRILHALPMHAMPRRHACLRFQVFLAYFLHFLSASLSATWKQVAWRFWGQGVGALLLVLGFHGTISHLWFLLFIKANLFLHFQRTIMVKCGLDSLTFSLFLCFGGVVWLMDLKNRFLNVRLAPYNGKLGLGSCLVK
jgi:hypothetical protein